jgi:hypothetical protein
MGNVQNVNYCTNEPLAQTFSSYLVLRILILLARCMAKKN